MNKAKLVALREKHGDHASQSEGRDEYVVPYAGLPTFLAMPHQSELQDIDIALIGVPFDLGVYNRAGARFGPRAIRNVSLLDR